jgi:hypothetical protein
MIKMIHHFGCKRMIETSGKYLFKYYEVRIVVSAGIGNYWISMFGLHVCKRHLSNKDICGSILVDGRELLVEQPAVTQVATHQMIHL